MMWYPYVTDIVVYLGPGGPKKKKKNNILILQFIQYKLTIISLERDIDLTRKMVASIVCKVKLRFYFYNNIRSKGINIDTPYIRDKQVRFF